MPRFSSCQYGPRWLLEPVITSVFQHQEGENWRRKTCHFLLRTFPRNCISLFCFYPNGKNSGQMARFGYREVEKCKSYSRWCQRFNLLCHGLHTGTAKWMDGQVWWGVHSCRASHFSHIRIFGLSQGSLTIAFAKYLYHIPASAPADMLFPLPEMLPSSFLLQCRAQAQFLLLCEADLSCL